MKLREKVRKLIETGEEFTLGASTFYHAVSLEDEVDSIHYKFPAGADGYFQGGAVISSGHPETFDIRSLVCAIFYNRRFYKLGRDYYAWRYPANRSRRN